MKKESSKLEIKDIASVEIINETESLGSADFAATKENISNLKNDAAETAECLASINRRIKDHVDKMEKLKILDLKDI